MTGAGCLGPIPWPPWRRWWRVRRRLSAREDRTASVGFAPPPTTLAEGVRVAGSRWTLESSVEAAQGDVGLEPSDVRTWTGGYRPVTLAMWALALRVIRRTGTIAVETVKKSRPLPPQASPRAAFKARRGLASCGACPNGGGCDGGAGGSGPPRSAPCWPGRRGVGNTSVSPKTTTRSVGRHALGQWRPTYFVTTVVLSVVLFCGRVATSIFGRDGITELGGAQITAILQRWA
jgi:hypothetical protein